MTLLDKKALSDLYSRRAALYDFTANLYYLMGFREQAYRKMAVEVLHLKPGDTAVEIGCGTGLNFSLLQRVVGPAGRIIGVDLTDRMLDKARQRVHAKGWKNMELVQADAAEFEFPSGVGGIISTFALTLVPEFDTVVRNGCAALAPGRRWVVLDLKMPSGRLSLFAPVFIFLTRPFGVTRELAERHPWESILKYLKNTTVSELYRGFAYIASGERGNGC